MGKVIVVQFVTADGVVQDPDGTGGTPFGGWAFHAGPEVFAGDKFGTSASLEHGVLLLGRKTWEMFSTRWPTRSGGFADVMNSARKVVASRSLDDVSAWGNSVVADGDLDDAVDRLSASGDVVVVGSTSVVHELAAAGRVDEYRLLVVATVAGGGERLFPDGAPPVALRLRSVEQRDTLAFLQYDVDR